MWTPLSVGILFSSGVFGRQSFNGAPTRIRVDGATETDAIGIYNLATPVQAWIDRSRPYYVHTGDPSKIQDLVDLYSNINNKRWTIAINGIDSFSNLNNSLAVPRAGWQQIQPLTPVPIVITILADLGPTPPPTIPPSTAPPTVPTPFGQTNAPTGVAATAAGENSSSIVGGAVGGSVAFLCLVALLFLFIRRRKHSRSRFGSSSSGLEIGAVSKPFGFKKIAGVSNSSAPNSEMSFSPSTPSNFSSSALPSSESTAENSQIPGPENFNSLRNSAPPTNASMRNSAPPSNASNASNVSHASPSTFSMPPPSIQASVASPPTSKAGPRFARALYDFNSDDPEDLPFKVGQVIKVVQNPSDYDWWTGELNGRTGLIPKTYVQFV